jgi:hypothetical protein
VGTPMCKITLDGLVVSTGWSALTLVVSTGWSALTLVVSAMCKITLGRLVVSAMCKCFDRLVVSTGWSAFNGGGERNV